jgi:membrane protease YdiL (CAAX protease family)
MIEASSTSPRRGLSAFEFFLGAGIVLAHNIWHVVPNEVLILSGLAVVSLRLRAGRWDWSTLGFHRPSSWRLIVIVALAAAALRILLGDFVIDPLTATIWPPAKGPEGIDEITGNAGNALLALGLVWTFAAFGEELSYRGYLLNRGAAAAGGSRAAFWCAAVVTAVLFGFGHFYKGPAGVLDSAVAGLILAAAYLLTGRCLWTSILAHGFINTCAIFLVYMGWTG